MKEKKKPSKEVNESNEMHSAVELVLKIKKIEEDDPGTSRCIKAFIDGMDAKTKKSINEGGKLCK